MKKATKKNIDDMLRETAFPTGKKIIWLLKQKKLTVSETQKEYIWYATQNKLENMLLTLNNSAQIASVKNYLQRNYDDWNEDKRPEQSNPIEINFNIKNDSGNKI